MTNVVYSQDILIRLIYGYRILVPILMIMILLSALNCDQKNGAVSSENFI